MPARFGLKLAATLLLAASVAACQTIGRDFARPKPDALRLGVMKRGEFLAAYGEPYRQDASVIPEPTGGDSGPGSAGDKPRFPPVGGSFQNFVHYYSVPAAAAFTSDAQGVRVLYSHFWNDVLVGYNFISSFAADSSNFDDSKVGLLTKGKTSYAQTVALLGEPTGKAIYPLISAKDNQAAVYQHSRTDPQKRTVASKRIVLQFGPDQLLQDFKFEAAEDALPPPPPSPAPVIVPIITPRR